MAIPLWVKYWLSIRITVNGTKICNNYFSLLETRQDEHPHHLPVGVLSHFNLYIIFAGLKIIFFGEVTLSAIGLKYFANQIIKFIIQESDLEITIF